MSTVPDWAAHDFPREDSLTEPDRSEAPARAVATRPGAGLRSEPWAVGAVDAVSVAGAVLLTGHSRAITAVYVFAVLLAFRALGIYRPRLTLRALEDAPRVLAGLAGCVVLLSPSVLDGGRGRALAELAALTGAVLVARTVTYTVFRALRSRRVYYERTLVIGAGQLGVELAHLLQERPQHGLVPVGFVDAPLDVRDESLPLPILGHIEQLDDILREHDIRRLVVAFGRVREAQWVSIMRSAISSRVEVHVVPRFFDIGLAPRDINVDEIWGIPLYRVRRAALRSTGWRAKRALDVLISGALLVLLAPLMGVIALAVRRTGPGVLFRQDRIGQHGRSFPVLKYRSVVHGHDGDTTWSVASGAERTRIGGLLRRTSLDELPQLWNVFRGDMSLVGPRPERPHFAHRFGTDIPGYHDRHRLPVGLTGWAQVNGLRGDTSIAQRARFDNFYVERWSLWFDLVILLRTIPAVLRDAADRR